MKKTVVTILLSALTLGLLAGCGEPAASGASSLAQSYPGKYYTDAVAWADAGGLLADTGAAFNPASQSPRANIVTYLYRNLAE